MEWLGGHPEFIVLPEEKAIPVPGTAVPLAWAETRETVERHLRVLEEAGTVVAIEGDDPFCVSPEALDARLRRLTRTKQTMAEPFGRMLRAFRQSGLWAVLAFRSFEEYARERLGLAPRTVRERLWLARKCEEMPQLREALETGELSLAKALLVAKGASPLNVQEKIEKAKDRPHEKVERETRKEEERRDSAADRIRLWGPTEAMELVRESIASAQAWSKANGREIDEGSALKLTAVYFLLLWKEHEKARGRRRPRARVLSILRKDGRCEMPRCTNPVEHLHHLKFRSRGGGDEVTNILGVCSKHHGAIHAGLIRVTGRSGDRVVFTFTGFPSATEVWVTEGDDDTTRVA